MIIWTLGQAVVVALYAAGIKPAGGYPTPPEATAHLGLAVAQLVLAVCFAPALFTDAGHCGRMAAVGLAWTTLAALLAGRSVEQSLPLLAVTAAWIAAIAAWRHRPAVTLALRYLTLAGPVLFYLSLEYNPRPLTLGTWPTLLSPPLGAAATCLHDRPWVPLFSPTALIVGAVVTHLAGRKQRGDAPGI